MLPDRALKIFHLINIYSVLQIRRGKKGDNLPYNSFKMYIVTLLNNMVLMRGQNMFSEK